MKNTRLLALDYGKKRIGLALSDELRVIASPYKTLEASSKMQKTVNLILKEVEHIEQSLNTKISHLIVGMPYTLSKQHSLMTDEVSLFVTSLQEKTTRIVTTVDERLTSQLAEKTMRQAKLNRKERAKVVDMVSASLVLQTYLDYSAHP